VLSALPGAIVGIPLGIVLFKAVAGHQTGSPSALWVAIAALGTLLAVVGLTSPKPLTPPVPCTANKAYGTAPRSPQARLHPTCPHDRDVL